MRLKISLPRPGLADGVYSVSAKGCIAASLHWGDGTGPWDDWTAIAYVPVDAYGAGVFRFGGGRAVPAGATHVYARCLASDFSGWEACRCELPPHEVPSKPCVRFSVLSDLHMTSKPGRWLRALSLASESDALLLVGDLVNDGLPDQFQMVQQALEERLPGIPALSVAGNHDYPRGNADPVYPLFQDCLLQRCEAMGIQISREEDGAYTACFGDVLVLGLQTAAEGRRVTLRGGLGWMEKWLSCWTGGPRVVLSHAPLAAHNPRSQKRRMPYFPQNAKVQRLIDGAGGVLFLSGHLHDSPQCARGCFEEDPAHGNFYYSDGSVCPVFLCSDEALLPQEWTDGVITGLAISEAGFELTARALHSGKRLARGHYRVGQGDLRSSPMR